MEIGDRNVPATSSSLPIAHNSSNDFYRAQHRVYDGRLHFGKFLSSGFFHNHEISFPIMSIGLFGLCLGCGAHWVRHGLFGPSRSSWLSCLRIHSQTDWADFPLLIRIHRHPGRLGGLFLLGTQSATTRHLLHHVGRLGLEFLRLEHSIERYNTTHLPILLFYYFLFFAYRRQLSTESYLKTTKNPPSPI